MENSNTNDIVETGSVGSIATKENHTDIAEVKKDKKKNKPIIARPLQLLDKELLGLLMEYGHAKISHIMRLLPDHARRTTNLVRARCRALVKTYGYLDTIKDGTAIVYRLSSSGYQVFTGKSPLAADSTLRRIEKLNIDLARAEWAIEQNGVVTLSGFEYIASITAKDLTMLDAIAEVEDGERKYLLVDSDNEANHIAQTLDRIKRFYEAWDKSIQLDVLTFYRNRKDKIDSFIEREGFNVTVFINPAH